MKKIYSKDFLLERLFEYVFFSSIKGRRLFLFSDSFEMDKYQSIDA